MAATPNAGGTALFGFCQEWPVRYSEQLYRQGGSHRLLCATQFDATPREKMACIGETNAVMAILEAEVVDPLTDICLHERLLAKRQNPTLAEDVTRVFLNRMESLAPPPQLGTIVLRNRENLRRRTINLIESQFLPFMNDLVFFYRDYSSFTSRRAIEALVGESKSVADTIACWTAFCAVQDKVRGDGTYTGREGIREANPPAAKKAVLPTASVSPQKPFTLVSEAEYQAQFRGGAIEGRPPALGDFTTYMNAVDSQIRFERAASARQESWREQNIRLHQRY